MINGRVFGKKKRKPNGTVNSGPLKRYAPKEKLRYGQGDKLGRTTLYNIFNFFILCIFIIFLKHFYKIL